jgi:hypothetical protein
MVYVLGGRLSVILSGAAAAALVLVNVVTEAVKKQLFPNP